MFKLILTLFVLIANKSLVNCYENQLDFIRNSNQLSLKLLNVLPKDENNFYSPFSITYSLYVLLNGANGVTETELKELLDVGAYDTLGSINSEVKATLEALEKKNIDETVVRFANRILLSDAYSLNENFQNSIKNEFNTSVDIVDFLRNASAITDSINDWVSNQTNGKIERLFDNLSNDTAFVTSNALYFSGRWRYPFDQNNTKNDTFYGPNDRTSTVQMMKQYRKLKYRPLPALNASLIELPFRRDSNISMIIILPNNTNGLNQLIQELDANTLNSELEQLINGSTRQLNLYIPKFELETDYNLKTPLKTLGLGSLFESQADLSRLTANRNLHLSQAIHKAVFKITEEGAEAGSAVGMTGVPHSWFPPIDVKVDRPFLFLIQDTNTGLILFMGQVLII